MTARTIPLDGGAQVTMNGHQFVSSTASLPDTVEAALRTAQRLETAAASYRAIAHAALRFTG